MTVEATRVDGIVPDLLGLAVPLEKLRPLPGNPRRGDVQSVARSYRTFGQRKPIVARRDGDTGIVIAGNHQLAAAIDLGWTHIAVVWVDDDDVTGDAFALADNRTADLGTYDDENLLAMLQAVHDADLDLFEATAYTEANLANLTRSLRDTATPGFDTDPGDLPTEPRSSTGDLYVLGDHRLLCGDSTSPGDVEKLKGGGIADAMWTDPPYGVSYTGKTKRALTIQNDDADGLVDLLAGAFALASTTLRPGSAIYCAHPPGARSLDFAQAFVGAGWRLHQTLVWVKNTIILGHSDYHYAHEPILYGYTPGDGRRGRGGEGWYGDNSQSSVLLYDKPARSEDHPTGKPVGLVEQCLTNSTPPDGVVYEPFAGSGTTLIACENLGRSCLAMEIDPAYCDVIVDRWERHTGRTSERA